MGRDDDRRLVDADAVAAKRTQNEAAPLHWENFAPGPNLPASVVSRASGGRDYAPAGHTLLAPAPVELLARRHCARGLATVQEKSSRQRRRSRTPKFVRFRSSSGRVPAPTSWLLWRSSSSAVDDRGGHVRSKVSSRRSGPAPSAPTRSWGRVLELVPSSLVSSTRDSAALPALASRGATAW